MTRALLLALSLLLLSACDGPVFVMPGGALSGTEVAAPAIWAFAEDGGMAQLETRPADPYSINLAYVQLNGRLYVYAGNTETNWVQHMAENPLVRIRVEENIYPVRAVRVTDAAELEAFAAVWSGRSAFQRDPLQFDEVWLYRLEVR